MLDLAGKTIDSSLVTVVFIKCLCYNPIVDSASKEGDASFIQFERGMQMKAKDRLIVALDCSRAQAKNVIEQTAESVWGFKVGMSPMSTPMGWDIIRMVLRNGSRLFIDM